MGVTIAIPELWAAFGSPPWATISATVGHLEAEHAFVGVIVVALIVLATARALSFPWPGSGPVLAAVGQQPPARTTNGRITKHPAPSPGEFQELSPVLYLGSALVITALIAWQVISVSDDKWVRGYWIYGSIAVFFGILPNLMARYLKTDAPYPTLFAWIGRLRHQYPPVALVILMGMVILLIHLAFYPWPHIVAPPSPSSP